jgi:hypothetical protein
MLSTLPCCRPEQGWLTVVGGTGALATHANPKKPRKPVELDLAQVGVPNSGA